jgi:hypothetical protein
MGKELSVKRIERRIEQLENALPLWKAPDEAEERLRVVGEGLAHLTTVELALLGELFDLRERYPEASPAEFWRMMTGPQREMQMAWNHITRRLSRGEGVDEKREAVIAKRSEKGPHAIPD